MQYQFVSILTHDSEADRHYTLPTDITSVKLLIYSLCRIVNPCLEPYVVWMHLDAIGHYRPPFCRYERTMESIFDKCNIFCWWPATYKSGKIAPNQAICKEWVELHILEWYHKFIASHKTSPTSTTLPVHTQISCIGCAYMVFPQDWGPQVQRLSEMPERWDRWRDSQRRYIGQISSTCSPGDWSPVGASWGLSSHASSEKLILGSQQDCKTRNTGLLTIRKSGWVCFVNFFGCQDLALLGGKASQ